MSSVDGRVMKTDEVRRRKFSKQMKLRPQQESCLSVCRTFIYAIMVFVFDIVKFIIGCSFIVDDIRVNMCATCISLRSRELLLYRSK